MSAERGGALSVRHLCHPLGVSRNWFHGAGVRPDDGEASALRDAIAAVVRAFRGHGYRRATKALQRDGGAVHHKRVRRVMRAESLLCPLERRWVATTDASHGLAAYPILVEGRVVAALNEVWVADITYVRLPSAFASLAAILDAFSRKVVGWALSRWIDTQVTLRALARAGLPAAAAHPPRRPGRAIRRGRLRRALARPGRADQYGRDRQPAQERPVRVVLQDAQDRGGVPEGVPHRRRGRGHHRPVHRRRLQHQAAAFGARQPTTGRVRGAGRIGGVGAGGQPMTGTIPADASRASCAARLRR